ncbi:MAG TPA: hypothetical protein EYP16_03410, partial [Candidatus Atribacteria bacterium]|nr:hypothetical protein [Candidatus Atribacteria bacterium]
LSPAGMGPLFSYNKPPQSLRATLNFIVRIVHLMQSNLAVGQLIDNFNFILAPYVKRLKDDEVKNALRTMFIQLNQTPTSRGDIIPLAISIGVKPSSKKHQEYYDEALKLFEIIVQVMHDGDDLGKPFLTPLLIVKLDRKLIEDSSLYNAFMSLCKLTSKWTLPYFINLNVDWQHNDVSYGWDLSRIFSIRRTREIRGGCLDTIIINLPRIALETRKDEDKFFSNLEDTIELCARAFDVKRESIKKRLESGHLPLLGLVVNDGYYYNVEEAIGNIGYVGLPEAVKIHTGYWIHENSTALRFARKIIEFMRKIVSTEKRALGLTHISLENVENRFERNDIASFGYSTIRE